MVYSAIGVAWIPLAVATATSVRSAIIPFRICSAPALVSCTHFN